jgi:hypothetical protein
VRSSACRRAARTTTGGCDLFGKEEKRVCLWP